MFLRTHIMEDMGNAGKTSENYDLSTRWIGGYENGCGQGGRVRFWEYAHRTDTIDPADDAFRVAMMVFDAELTHRFRGCRTDVLFAGGARIGNMEILDENGDEADINFLGITLAADVESIVCCNCNRYWSAIYGGRMSFLGGNWEGDSNGFVDTSAGRDDNIVVSEAYAGVEYGCCHCGSDLYLQLKFEIQNWHSDHLAQNAGGDSINFIGPAFRVGATF